MADSQTGGPRSRSRRRGVTRTTYTDPQGFKYLVDVPVGREDRPDLGIRVGPPDLESLGLPKDITLALNHQLFDRELYTAEDAKRRSHEVPAALQAAYKVSATAILNLYQSGG